MSDTDRKHSDATAKAEGGQTAAEAVRDGRAEADEPKPPKAGLFKRIQAKLNLDVPTLLLMLK